MNTNLKPVTSRRSGSGAFTLVELLVVIAMIALGALLLVPALARTRPGAKAIQCRNHLKQLTAAWRKSTLATTTTV